MTEETISFEQYVAGLPPDRRGVVERVWRVVRESAAPGYTERVGPKFLTLLAGDEQYVALASQKNYLSLYLMPLYVFPELREKLDNSGRKLKCGKSCINFKRAEELPLDVIAEIVGAYDADAYASEVRRARGAGSRGHAKG